MFFRHDVSMNDVLSFSGVDGGRGYRLLHEAKGDDVTSVPKERLGLHGKAVP